MAVVFFCALVGDACELFLALFGDSGEIVDQPLDGCGALFGSLGEVADEGDGVGEVGVGCFSDPGVEGFGEKLDAGPFDADERVESAGYVVAVVGFFERAASQE